MVSPEAFVLSIQQTGHKGDSWDLQVEMDSF